jgi:hypothetical protein
MAMSTIIFDDEDETSADIADEKVQTSPWGSSGTYVN